MNDNAENRTEPKDTDNDEDPLGLVGAISYQGKDESELSKDANVEDSVVEASHPNS